MSSFFNVWQSARAKINLTLHVGPVRGDGYHPLQSLVVFADIGDRIMLSRRGDTDRGFLSIIGPFAKGLSAGGSNLIQKAVSLYEDDISRDCRIHLEKNLPLSSGIGGGSADGAAVMRALDKKYKRRQGEQAKNLIELGADIPVCLLSKTCQVHGIGEVMKLLPGRGILHAVLVNPGLPLSTQAVFKAFDRVGAVHKNWNAPDDLEGRSLMDITMNGRNDLQQIACELLPEIKDVLASIEAQEANEIARMSGSGATCFGLFPSEHLAVQAAAHIKAEHPGWWCIATKLGDEA